MAVQRNRERPGKILVAMLRLSAGTTKPLKYEDIVVRAFELFPEEFGLRGHPEFPDSSDIHKPLYGLLKRSGMVRAANKTFALTPRGIETARRLDGVSGKGLDQAKHTERMTRDVRGEVERMQRSAAFRLFAEGRTDKILDTDFYEFLGCTVRTPRNDFLGRTEVTSAAVQAAVQLEQPDGQTARLLEELWKFLQATFRQHMDKGSSKA